MIEHLMNCHGEWQAVIAIVGSLPLVGAWLREKFTPEERDRDPQ